MISDIQLTQAVKQFSKRVLEIVNDDGVKLWMAMGLSVRLKLPLGSLLDSPRCLFDLAVTKLVLETDFSHQPERVRDLPPWVSSRELREICGRQFLQDYALWSHRISNRLVAYEALRSYPRISIPEQYLELFWDRLERRGVEDLMLWLNAKIRKTLVLERREPTSRELELMTEFLTNEPFEGFLCSNVISDRFVGV